MSRGSCADGSSFGGVVRVTVVVSACGGPTPAGLAGVASCVSLVDGTMDDCCGSLCSAFVAKGVVTVSVPKVFRGTPTRAAGATGAVSIAPMCELCRGPPS